MSDQIEALKREREHYLVHGKTDRAKQVADVLKDLGVKVEEPRSDQRKGAARQRKTAER